MRSPLSSLLAGSLAILAAAADARADDLSLRTEVSRYLARATGAADDASTFRAFWKDGLRFETSDKLFSLAVGGRAEVDWFWKSGDDGLAPLASSSDGSPTGDGVRFRRARLGIQGTIYDNVEFSAEFEFATSSVELRGVFLGLRKLPGVGNLRVGHFKEPYGLEEQTSANFITFMERAPSTQAFAPVYNTGLLLFRDHAEGRFCWQAGIFRNTAENGGGLESDDGYSLTVRLTGLPVDQQGDRPLFLHVGVAGSYRTSPDGDARFRARPSVASGPRFVDTGSLSGTDSVILLGVELALVYGPFSVQGEFMMAELDSTAGGGDPSFSGFYLQASWFATGEHRPYDRKSGRFGRVRPKKNFGKGGWGALELAVRFSNVDLNDGTIANGGSLDDIVAGLNWYLNPNTRVQINVVIADLNDRTTATGDFTGVQSRIHVDF